jgi:hypothetical protein
MSKPTEVLKVWRCPRCGKQLEGATRSCVDGHVNTHAEEVEVIPAEQPEQLEASLDIVAKQRDAAIRIHEAFKKRLRKEADRMYAESGDPQLNEFAQQQAQFDADKLIAAISAAEQEKP